MRAGLRQRPAVGLSVRGAAAAAPAARARPQDRGARGDDSCVRPRESWPTTVRRIPRSRQRSPRCPWLGGGRDPGRHGQVRYGGGKGAMDDTAAGRGRRRSRVGSHGLREHFANGYLNESTMLWAEGRKEWMLLSSIPELQSAVTSKDQSKQDAPDVDDDFEKFQKEAIEAEAEVDQRDDERPATTPDGEEEFTDDDGTIYKWDRTLRAWVPQEEIAGLVGWPQLVAWLRRVWRRIHERPEGVRGGGEQPRRRHSVRSLFEI